MDNNEGLASIFWVDRRLKPPEIDARALPSWMRRLGLLNNNWETIGGLKTLL
jgi:hypothetical protein